MNGHNGHPVNLAETDTSAGPGHEFDRARTGANPRRRQAAPRTAPASATAPAGEPSFSIDAGSLLRPVGGRWYWLIIGGIVGTLLGGLVGLWLWDTGYSASTQLVRYDPPVASDAYKPQQLNGPTLIGMMQSVEILNKIGRKMKPPVSGAELNGRVKVVPERNSELVTITATGGDPEETMQLANMFNAAIIEFTQEHQRTEAKQAEIFVTEQLQATESDLAQARKNLPTNASALSSLGESSASPLELDRMAAEIQTARSELSKLLVRYTDAHPLVIAKRAEIAALEGQVPKDAAKQQIEALAAGKPIGSTAASLAASGSREAWEMAYYTVRTLENFRLQLLNRQRAIELFKANPPGNFRVMQAATTADVAAHRPTLRILLLAVFFGLVGIVVAGGELLRRELFDSRLKTEADVTRVTGLPVLATLGDLRQMSLAAREAWAFRTWIALQDRLAYSPNHGLICGITSSNSGDGRSTWINLLAGAARKCGFRVLTIATRPTIDPTGAADEVAAEAAEAAEAAREPAAVAANGKAPDRAAPPARNGAAGLLSNPVDLANSSRAFAGESEFTALTASALFTPAMVTEKLMGPETDPLVHIPLPGWTWNLERRKQWQGALNVWRKIDNVVILVELPPASMPESVLLASNLPNLVWLVQSGRSEARDTRDQLETLRHARCNLVGTVINRAMTPISQGRFARWVGCLAMIATLGISASQTLQAEEANPSPTAADTQSASGAATPRTGTFSVVSPAQRAQWQQRLTLGPGDVLNFALYGDAESLREEVPIGPDGRVSYLEAHNVMAAGLTVDEFRQKMSEELGRFRRAPQVLITPVTFKSKKYYVLGKVTQRGAYPLDRPITLLEAVARAGGLETGLAPDRSLVELADLSRSFVARRGQRMPVDFQRLFQEGDLTQNIPIEPNDYIYFPGQSEKEVYVLGAVGAPGSYLYHGSTGAVGAIAARGGFLDQAWKKKILVIRGGMGRPETFEVNAHDVLAGKGPDVKLQPKDIVYVSERPWIRAEELLDAAATAFVTSAVVTWTNDKVTRDP